MAKEFYLVANWKMHFTPEEGKKLYQEFCSIQEAGIKLAVACPATTLSAIQQVADTQVQYGAQNVHFELSGAFTGEISPSMVKSCGASFSLIGHSERRHLFHEDEDLLSKRATGALEQGLDIIYCVGETLEDREGGDTNTVLQRQMESILHLFGDYASRITVAYEPVWAIGTGKVATEVEIREAHAEIKTIVSTAHQGIDPVVLYGGSVKPENIAEISALEEVNGALVGGASLKTESFAALAQNAC